MQIDNNWLEIVYEQLIDKWLEAMRANPSKCSQIDFFKACYSQFTKNLSKYTGIYITFDCTVALVIQKMLSYPKYIRWSQDICMKGQLCYLISKVSHFLYYNEKFINKKKYQAIQECIKYNLQHQIKIFLHSASSHLKHQSSQQKIMGKWNKYIKLPVKIFWSEFYLERPECQNAQQLTQAFLVLQKILNKNIDPVKMKKINELVKHNYILKEQKLVLGLGCNQFLEQLVIKNSLFNSSQIIQNYKSLAQRFKQVIEEKYIQYIKSYHYFGSFVSLFAIKNESDIDICIQFKKIKNHDQQNFGYNLLKQISWFLKQKFKQQFSVNFWKDAKVPCINIVPLNHESSSFIPKNIDIVCNNIHGVENSILLSKFSKIPQVLNLGILVKIWGKKRNLINRQKFSSYGFILMVLYYLMREGYLSFLQQEITQIDEMKLQNYIKQKKFPNLYNGFLGFLQLYSQKSAFYQNNEIVRITKYKQCQIDQRNLINMIDPLNYTNPGRFKLYNKYQLWKQIQIAKNALKSKDTKQLHQILQKK